jgi:sec-independent protein translocase protein TatA
MNLHIISTLFLGNPLLAISGEHILVVVIALVLLFGGKKIPEFMGGIGKGMKEFKKAIKEDETVPEAKKEEPKDVSVTEIKDSAAELKA